MRRSIWIGVLIIVLLGCIAATMSFFQGAGVNRDNPTLEDLEGTDQP